MTDDNYRIPEIDTPPIEKLLPNIFNAPKKVGPVEVVEKAARGVVRDVRPVIGALFIVAALSQPNPQMTAGLAAVGGWLLRR